MKLAFASLAVLALLALPAAPAQRPGSAAPAPQPGKTALSKPLIFDVVSVKPNNSGEENANMGMNPDGFTARNVDLHMFLLMAYHLHDNQLLNEPKWTETDHWDMDARVSAEDMSALGTLNFKQRLDMFQAVLADRFGLKVHHETRDLPVYTLVVAKGGEKMKPSKIDPGQPIMEGMPGVINYRRAKAAIITASMATMDGLAEEISDDLGRKVVDRTGLTGRYDFALKWTPEEDLSAGATPDADAPSIFTAVEEQLGLKLLSAKGPVDVIVIDHIDRPSEN